MQLRKRALFMALDCSVAVYVFQREGEASVKQKAGHVVDVLIVSINPTGWTAAHNKAGRLISVGSVYLESRPSLP